MCAKFKKSLEERAREREGGWRCGRGGDGALKGLIIHKPLLVSACFTCAGHCSLSCFIKYFLISSQFQSTLFGSSIGTDCKLWGMVTNGFAVSSWSQTGMRVHLGLSGSARTGVDLSVSHQHGTVECKIWRAGVFVVFYCLGMHGGLCAYNLVANPRLD